MASHKAGFVLALLLLLVPIALVIIPAFVGWFNSLWDQFPDIPGFPLSGIFSDLSASFENLRKFVFPLISLVFGITFQELFTLKARREAEVNKIERVREAQKGGSKIGIARTFAFSLLIMFIIFDIAFSALNWTFRPLAYAAIWFTDIFFWVFICLIVTFLSLRAYFMHATAHFAREILITVKRTRIQKFALFLKFLSISSITAFMAVLILSNFFAIPFLSIIQGVLFYAFIFTGVNIGIFFISRRYFDLNYSYFYPIEVNPLMEKKDTDADHFFCLSNSFPLKFQKGFVVLELKGVLTDLAYEPNYKVLRFIKELVLEVCFSKNNRRLLFWLFIDRFRKNDLVGALQAIAEEFPSLFPMAQVRILEFSHCLS